MSYCIKNKKVPLLLQYLFQKSQFLEILKGQSREFTDHAYREIKEKVIGQINSILYLSEWELVEAGQTFTMKKVGVIPAIDVKSIKFIDRNYISELSSRALRDIDNQHYDSAITKARTLLEEVFCYVIEKKGEAPVESGNIDKLYNQVKKLHNMHHEKDMDIRVHKLLSGLQTIILAIAEMRNKDSDAHGRGGKRINISDHHARLFVNASTIVANFILEVHKKQIASDR